MEDDDDNSSGEDPTHEYDLDEQYDREYEKTFENLNIDEELDRFMFNYHNGEFYPNRNIESSSHADDDIVESVENSDSDRDDLRIPNVLIGSDEDASEDEDFDYLADTTENGENEEGMRDEEGEMEERINPDIAEVEGAKETKGRFISRLQYMLYRAQMRRSFRNRFSASGKLGQTYIMDQFSRIIQNRMMHIRKHNTQSLLSTRRKLLHALQRQLNKKHAGVTIGAVTTVPATVVGSPRYMRRKFENAVAVANALGPPSVFVTFTASSAWKEVKESLKGEPWPNHPFTICEIFKKKVEKLLEVLIGKPKTKGSRDRRPGLWGECVWYVYSVEFQQRGAPHIHLLMRLKNPPKTAEEVDKISVGTLPVVPPPDDPKYEEMKRLRELVEKHHIHRPCQDDDDAYCNKGRKKNSKYCTKGFPKQFQPTTELGDRRYPNLKRPDNGEFCIKRVEGRDFKADNRYVVPYNPTLLALFETHCNVEVVTSAGALKYLYKYVFKGIDRTLLEVLPTDGSSYSSPGQMTLSGHLLYPKDAHIQHGVKMQREKDAVDLLRSHGIGKLDSAGNKVAVFDETRYVEDLRAFTAIEAAWHISTYRITNGSHTIANIFVHQQFGEPVHFLPGEEEEVAQKKDDEYKTTLKAWFLANQQVGNAGDKARELTFDEMPKFFSYRDGCWILRKRNWSRHVIGHVKSVSPRNLEQFAIRMLVRVVKGPKSFNELRTVDGVEYGSFVEAAKKRKLMNDQAEWDFAIKEAATTELPITIRRLFITILAFNAPTNGLQLWIDNKEEMLNRNNWSEEMKEAQALQHIQSGLQAHGLSLSKFGLPEVQDKNLPAMTDWDNDNGELELATAVHERIADDQYKKLNEEQKKAMDKILKDIDEDLHKSYFVQGTGGTGKTFLYRTLYHRLCGKGLKVLCVAHTGIAATLLQNGQTAHRAFNLPLLANETMHSTLEYESQWANHLRSVDVVVFDEATMVDKRVLKAIEEMFVYLHPEKQGMPFGGVSILFGGDWRQTLPIVDDVRGEGILEYTIKRSPNWANLEQLTLTRNQRALGDKMYAEWLEKIGNGTDYIDAKWQIVKLPKRVLAESEEAITDWVFGNGRIQNPSTSDFSCVLTVDNVTTEELNDLALSYINGKEKVYLSIDEYDPKCGFEALPTESYNNMLPTGMPPHALKLKVNAVVILLRNLNVPLGLVNGTRMRITELNNDTIKCSPITKNGKTPNVVVLSRIMMTSAKPGSKDVAFIRTQYPIRLAHAMTINKSQGQTLDRVGIILRTPVFAHGQLYVALSRVRKFDDVKIFINDSTNPTDTRNVVYHNIL